MRQKFLGFGVGGWQSLTDIKIKPTQLIGKDGPINFKLNDWGPTGVHVRDGAGGRGTIRIREEDLAAFVEGATVRRGPPNKTNNRRRT